jgi:hypothetical protein
MKDDERDEMLYRSDHWDRTDDDIAAELAHLTG